MTPKATIFKAELQISDMDRQYYGAHSLTLARHPSETDERMMVRLLAFALYADEQLSFTRGLSAVDEPEIWQKSLSGELETWIDLGQPDERRIRQASGKSDQVVVVAYGRAAEVWWEKIQGELGRFDNVSVLHIPAEACQKLTALADRNMSLQFTIEDETVWISSGDEMLEITPVRWLAAS